MKKFRFMIKVISAGIVAMALLAGICTCYYTLPVRIANEQHNTDYVWPPNAVWMKMSEGISWGQMDAQGYNNPEVIQNPDILVLGSSHMEAINVMQDENTTSRL